MSLYHVKTTSQQGIVIARISDDRTIAYPPSHYDYDEKLRCTQAIVDSLNETRANVYVRERTKRRPHQLPFDFDEPNEDSA